MQHIISSERKIETQLLKIYGNRKGNCNREAYNNTDISQETNKQTKSQINNLTYQLMKFKKKARIANRAHSHLKEGHNKEQRRSKCNKDHKQQKISTKSFL